MTKKGTISREFIKKLSRLSRIAIEENEIDEITLDLQNILNYVELLSEVDTTHVQATAWVSEFAISSPVRKDEIEETTFPEAFAKLAPQTTARMVRVPQVIEQE